MIIRGTRAHNPAQLIEELLTAFPALASVDPAGRRVTAAQLASDGDAIGVTLPDDAGIPAEAVAAVITAHVPQPEAPAPVTALTPAQRDVLRAYFAGTEPSTLAEMRAVLRALTIYVRRRLGEM